jgi:peptidoglycan hydrolase-like protein with peptidoglycan-binding domain
MRRGKRDDQDVVASFEEGQQPEYSDTVRLTQEALRTIGYELEADGYYGPNTAETVKQFQEEQGLEPTGVLDVYTHNRINELYREAGGDNRNFGGVNYRGE